MNAPAEKLYYSISEVSESTGVKAHVLRYWESQFSVLRPRKSRGGMRMYRPKDVAVVERIRHLLYERGFTIAGARRQLLADRRSGLVFEEPETLGPGQEAVVVYGREDSGPVKRPGAGFPPAAVGRGVVLREIKGEIAALRALLAGTPRTRLRG
jgi:hypothetical protein